MGPAALRAATRAWGITKSTAPIADAVAGFLKLIVQAWVAGGSLERLGAVGRLFVKHQPQMSAPLLGCS
eukprot:CAMPEP_0204235320 /NCGR_PEP_ID=MMETSP0361-20130328/91595_1 /ASSEMBLY_ACC=CAM_ASM_000343 /TAXON_ID=268821 /ORGANISM="Scrippsiella Hangoei, Strain SHTV-5" /LENGTH=68 /DNA_ID=CAMNT_0051206671 /DNA_START=302 /DNA_END=508 /DNA_ORIENTATION=-